MVEIKFICNKCGNDRYYGLGATIEGYVELICCACDSIEKVV